MATSAEHKARAEECVAGLAALDAEIKNAGGSSVLDPYAAQSVNATRDYTLRLGMLHATLALVPDPVNDEIEPIVIPR